MRPLALYSSHGGQQADEKFIAIAEGIHMPLYAFTYGIEMIQFYYEDPTATLERNGERSSRSKKKTGTSNFPNTSPG